MKFLSDDASGGRADAAGLEREATYVADRFRDAKLEPGGDRGSFFQWFDADVPVNLEHGQHFHLPARLRNVVGILRGHDATLGPIIIGAHYDHIGFGGEFSDSPDAVGQVHNGADDNASGTAGVIELCRSLSGEARRLPRTIVCAAFAGEEIGLLGSAAFVEHPPVALAHAKAMINLDMIGRAHGRVMVGAFGSAPWMRGLLSRMQRWTTLSIGDFKNGGYAPGSSDDDSFEHAGIPAVAFFTGFHSDYHRPGDDWQRIDAEGGAAIVDLVATLVRSLAQEP